MDTPADGARGPGKVQVRGGVGWNSWVNKKDRELNKKATTTAHQPRRKFDAILPKPR